MLRVLRVTGIVCFILGFAGVERSEAQTYNFSFTAGALGTASINFIMGAGTSVSSVSGGTGFLTGAILSTSSSNIYGVGTAPTFTTTSPYFANGGIFPQNLSEVRAAGSEYFFEGSGAGPVINKAAGIAYSISNITCSPGCAASPSPIPGAGLYSWLALIIAGLWIKRKTIQALAKETKLGVVRVFGSARKLFSRPARAQSVQRRT